MTQRKPTWLVDVSIGSGMSRRWTVATAIVRRAEMRAALQHFAWNPDLRLAGIETFRFRPAARVLRDAAGFRSVGRMPRRPEVGRPLPHIADHVVKAVAIRRVTFDRRSPRPPVSLGVLERELALPGVRHMLALRRQLVAPGEFRAFPAPPRRELPFRLGRQLLPRPMRVGLCVTIGDMHYRVVVEAPYRRSGAIRLPPVCAELEFPPLRPVAKVDRAGGRAEHQRAGAEHVREGAGIVLRIRGNLRERHVSGRADEFAELPVRNRRLVNPECLDFHPMRRRLLRVMGIRPHAKDPGRNMRHMRRRDRGRRGPLHRFGQTDCSFGRGAAPEYASGQPTTLDVRACWAPPSRRPGPTVRREADLAALKSRFCRGTRTGDVSEGHQASGKVGCAYEVAQVRSQLVIGNSEFLSSTLGARGLNALAEKQSGRDCSRPARPSQSECLGCDDGLAAT